MGDHVADVLFLDEAILDRVADVVRPPQAQVRVDDHMEQHVEVHALVARSELMDRADARDRRRDRGELDPPRLVWGLAHQEADVLAGEIEA